MNRVIIREELFNPLFNKNCDTNPADDERRDEGDLGQSTKTVGSL